MEQATRSNDDAKPVFGLGVHQTLVPVTEQCAVHALTADWRCIITAHRPGCVRHDINTFRGYGNPGNGLLFMPKQWACSILANACRFPQGCALRRVFCSLWQADETERISENRHGCRLIEKRMGWKPAILTEDFRRLHLQCDTYEDIESWKQNH